MPFLHCWTVGPASCLRRTAPIATSPCRKKTCDQLTTPRPLPPAFAAPAVPLDTRSASATCSALRGGVAAIIGSASTAPNCGLAKPCSMPSRSNRRSLRRWLGSGAHRSNSDAKAQGSGDGPSPEGDGARMAAGPASDIFCAPARLDCHSYSTAMLPVWDLGLRRLVFPELHHALRNEVPQNEG